MQPFGRNRYGPKIGWGLFPFGEGELGPHLTQIHPAIWPQQIWTENWRGLCPFGGGGAGSPTNTIWPEPRPTSLPSDILIYPAVWPQQTWAENSGVPLWGEGQGWARDVSGRDRDETFAGLET